MPSKFHLLGIFAFIVHRSLGPFVPSNSNAKRKSWRMLPASALTLLAASSTFFFASMNFNRHAFVQTGSATFGDQKTTI